MEAYNSTIELVNYLRKFATVFVIFGNVESSNADTKKESKKIGLPLPFLTDDLKKLENVKVINNKFIKFKGLKIGGLQYFIDFNWIEDFKPKDLKKKLAQAKKDNPPVERALKSFLNLDILVCHQPPYGYLDVVSFPAAPADWQGKHSGSRIILDYINKNQPKYVFCGHIHEGEGSIKIGRTEVFNLGFCGYRVIEINN
jgi:Icc-related predicted phosphoesterase